MRGQLSQRESHPAPGRVVGATGVGGGAPGVAGRSASSWAAPAARARVFTWNQEHVLPGANPVPAVHASGHAARLFRGAAGSAPRASVSQPRRKWRERGLFRVARRAEGPAGTGSAREEAQGPSFVSFPRPACCSCYVFKFSARRGALNAGPWPQATGRGRGLSLAAPLVVGAHRAPQGAEWRGAGRGRRGPALCGCTQRPSMV